MKALFFLQQRWKLLLKKDFFFQDMLAGLTVSCVALPLSIALAMASGVPPALGIISAVTAGILCSLLGGSPLSIAGQGNTLVLFIFNIVHTEGLNFLFFVGLGCGILQAISGFFQWGRFSKYLPSSLLEGITAGIGVALFISQLPLVLGFSKEGTQTTSNILKKIFLNLENIRSIDFFLGSLSFIMTLWFPYFFPRFPISLVLIIGTTLFVSFFHFQIALLGAAPLFFPGIHFLKIFDLPVWNLIKNIFIFYFFSSFETLLSVKIASPDGENQIKNQQSFNQELIGQGIANISISLLGGVPIVGASGRSTINIQAGAKTFRSGIFHSLFILLWLFLFSQYIEKIPIPVLAGILMSIGIRMFKWRYFFYLWKSHQGEAIHYLIPFFSVVLFGISMGIEVGILFAFLIFGLKKFGGKR